MNEPVRWRADGTPASERFDDVYRSEGGGLAQSQTVFLQGCGLPEAWRGRSCFTVLETGLGLGLNFLALWHAWRQDPARSARLHHVALEAWPVQAEDLRRSAAPWPELAPLADELARAWWGLVPGVHRISLDGARVQLTLLVGDALEVLQAWRPPVSAWADAVFLDGFAPDRNPAMWSPALMAEVARACRPGARVATWSVARPVREALAGAGFDCERLPGLPPKRQRLAGVYRPRWRPTPPVALSPTRALVLGAGLAGAAAAHALARHGCAVQVFDPAPGPAQGASALPAGLFGPHVSGDDAPLSRLTRAGLRHTWQFLHGRPELAGQWACTGILEHRVGGRKRWRHADHPGGADWTREPDLEQLAAARLQAQAGACWWHPRAGWARPGAMVEAWLTHPGIETRFGASVQGLHAGDAGWRLLGEHGKVLAEAELVVLAAGPATAALLESVGARLPLNAVRGQVSAALRGPQDRVLPPFALNGHGCLLPEVPTPAGPAWVCGATFDRRHRDGLQRPQDDALNLAKLRELLPELTSDWGPERLADPTRSWAGLRCTVPDRVPVVGPPDATRWPGLWVSTGFGARGLCLSGLCGELLAGWAFGEPPPVEPRLAQALQASRHAALSL